MRTERTDWAVYSAWLTAIVLAFVFFVVTFGALLSSVAEFRAFWSSGPWAVWVALLLVALLHAAALLDRRARHERAIVFGTMLLVIVMLVALAELRLWPLDDVWYAAATVDEPKERRFVALALIEFESPNAGPCGGARGRCVLLLYDDGRRQWMSLGDHVGAHHQIVVVERTVGVFSGHSREFVEDGIEAKDWRLYWANHLRRLAERTQ